MTCSDKVATKANYKAVWNVSRALMTGFHLYIPHIIMGSSNGEPVNQPVHVHQFRSVDWFQSPFTTSKTDHNKPKIPAIAVGVPDMMLGNDGYDSRLRKEFLVSSSEENGVGKFIRQGPSAFPDLQYNIKLISDNTIVLQYLMTQFAQVMRNHLAELEVYDDLNDITRFYDVDIIDMPKGSFAVATNEGIYEARASVAVRGVELTSGDIEEFEQVTDLCVVAVGMDQQATATVSDTSGDLVITITDIVQEE